MLFADLIRERAFNKKDFILYKDERISYGSYYIQSLRYANLFLSFKKKNVRGFNIGIMMYNMPEFLYALGGCSFVGATLVGINTGLKGDELARDLNFSDFHMLITDERCIENVNAIKHNLDIKDSDILVKNYNLEHHLDRVIARDAYTSVPNENAGTIIFTSGTTGMPKGIEVSWQKLVDVGLYAIDFLGYKEEDVGYVCMPLNHSNSLYLNVMPAFMNNATIALREKFSSSNFVDDILKFKATIWNSVGEPVHYVLGVTEKINLRHTPLRIVVSTGATPDDQEAFAEKFGLERFIEAYGSSEVGAVSVKGKDAHRRSVGKINPDKVRIFQIGADEECVKAELDANGKVTNFSESVGEIVVRCPTNFTGYYKNPDATVEKERNGYHRMSDLGCIDKDNNLFFMGRVGDWIRHKGHNFAASDLEDVIARYKGVENCAAFGIPHEDGTGDYVFIVIQAKNFDKDSFLDYCSRNLEKGRIPHFVRVVEKLPLTETNKIQKKVLKQEHFVRTGAEEDYIFFRRENGYSRFVKEEYEELIERYKAGNNLDRLLATIDSGL